MMYIPLIPPSSKEVKKTCSVSSKDEEEMIKEVGSKVSIFIMSRG